MACVTPRDKTARGPRAPLVEARHGGGAATGERVLGVGSGGDDGD